MTTAGKGMHTPTPWKFDDKLGCRSIKGAKCYSHKQAQYLKVAYTVGLADDAVDRANAQLIVTAVNSHSTLTEENARLLQENTAMREERAKVISVIPLNFLQAHDLPGATGITEHLDLVGAIRSLVNMGRKWEDRARSTLTQGEGK